MDIVIKTFIKRDLPNSLQNDQIWTKCWYNVFKYWPQIFYRFFCVSPTIGSHLNPPLIRSYNWFQLHVHDFLLTLKYMKTHLKLVILSFKILDDLFLVKKWKIIIAIFGQSYLYNLSILFVIVLKHVQILWLSFLIPLSYLNTQEKSMKIALLWQKIKCFSKIKCTVYCCTLNELKFTHHLSSMMS